MLREIISLFLSIIKGMEGRVTAEVRNSVQDTIAKKSSFMKQPPQSPGNVNFSPMGRGLKSAGNTQTIYSSVV